MSKITKRLAVNGRNLFKFLSIAMLCCCCLVGFAKAQKTENKQENADSGHAGHQHVESKPSQSNTPAAKLVIPDVEVLTQDGRQVKFYTDLVKGKKVLISFVFTSCRVTCPMVGRNFQKLQEQIGKDLGKDVFLITVSTDPLVDTPQILTKWGEKYNRRDGWTLVTGDEAKMKQLLLTLTGSSRQREGEHTSLLILFDGTSGVWQTTSSLMEPSVLLDNLSKLGKTPAN
jgi:protein SCO1/2